MQFVSIHHQGKFIGVLAVDSSLGVGHIERSIKDAISSYENVTQKQLNDIRHIVSRVSFRCLPVPCTNVAV